MNKQGFHMPTNMGRSRSSQNASFVQYEHHADPVDADDFDQSDNVESAEYIADDPSLHSGFTSDAQKKFDPSLFRVVVVGSLRMAFYDDEVVSVDVVSPTSDDCSIDIERWFADLLIGYAGKVSL